MTERTFRLALGAGAGAGVVHDPCTGLTHPAPPELAGLPSGRVRLDDARVADLPAVHPSRLSRPAPVSVCWSPLVRCNLSCPHCLDDKTVSAGDRQDRAEVAEALAASGVLGVDVSGGEPLLLRDLAALVGRLTGRGVAVSVTTNGWHLAARVGELVGRVDAVRVSLDGPTAAEHDRRRGAGSFDRAVEGIRASLALGVPVQIQTVLMASTAPAAQAMVDLAASLGVHGLTFLQMLPIGHSRGLAATHPLSDEHARRLVAALNVPGSLRVRLRERAAADGFTVVRADGTVWRNTDGATTMSLRHRLRVPSDLLFQAADGSA